LKLRGLNFTLESWLPSHVSFFVHCYCCRFCTDLGLPSWCISQQWCIVFGVCAQGFFAVI